jgi:hypothetical protein
MEINHPAGLIAVILGIISFYGMTYVVIALNVGWRFGYWLASACFGVLMVLMSVFWITTALGPQGHEAKWVPLAADEDRISQARVDEQSLSSPGRYPSSPWQTADVDGPLAPHIDAFSSAATNCLSTKPDDLEVALKEICGGAQTLLPAKQEIPVLGGTAVAVLPELEDVRFSDEDGTLLAQGRVVPTTHDPRVAKDPEAGEPLGNSFVLLARYDKGSLRVPALMSLLIFAIYAAFHLWGLSRAERRKLSPVI